MTNTVSFGKNGQVDVHCLVHPGFDEGEYPEFESNIYGYINFIAEQTNDILLIVTDGERFDLDQIQQFAILDILEAISLFLGIEDGGIGKLTKQIAKERGTEDFLATTLANNGLSQEFYAWCKENIDMSELDLIAERWEALRKGYNSGQYESDMQAHDNMAAILRQEEIDARMNLDIVALANKALDEFGPARKRPITYRNLGNKGRFFRIFQYALEKLGDDRVREVFIRDGEDADTLPVLPVKGFQEFRGDMILTPHASNDEEKGQVFNASEEYSYGNAAKLRDDTTYELSVSRNRRLIQQQPKNIFDDMGVEVNSDTKFLFSGEYRDRCVSNVFRIMNYRMSPITGDNFHIANDILTLQHPQDKQK